MPRMPRERYRRRLRFCCCTCVKYFESWFCTSALGLVLFQMFAWHKNKTNVAGGCNYLHIFNATVLGTLRPRFGFPLKSLSSSIALHKHPQVTESQLQLLFLTRNILVSFVDEYFIATGVDIMLATVHVQGLRPGTKLDLCRGQRSH